MNTEKALDMIDEYLLEPNNINKEWVEVLTTVRKVLVDNAQLKRQIEKFEKIEHLGTKTIERQEVEIERLNIELQAMRNAANGFKADVERLQEECGKGANALIELMIQNQTVKNEAIKEFAERLKTIMCNNVAYVHKPITTTIIDNLVKEFTGAKGEIHNDR